MDLKMCPTCKTLVFADMETCFGCMYRFGSDPEREEAVRREYEASDFPEHDDAEDAVASEGSGEAADDHNATDGGERPVTDRVMGVAESRSVVPWPPPAEGDVEWSCAGCPAARRTEVAVPREDVSIRDSQGEGRSFASVFQLPAMTVTVRADGPLPAGVSLSLNLDPPRGETDLCVPL